LSRESHDDGITFWTQRGSRQIVNFPKQHWSNGVAKNRDARTSGRYKATVRMFKNARSAAVDRHLLSADSAPSFFVECLIYNAPDNLFMSTHASTYVSIVNWLAHTDMRGFVYGHELAPLFGPSPEQWEITKAQQTVNGLVALWQSW
jgi:hypothetical protein